MATMSLSASAATLLVLLVSVFLFNRWRSTAGSEPVDDPDAVLRDLPEPTDLARTLKAALPQNVLFPTDAALFKEVMNSYWAKHNREVIPACFARPESTKHLQSAVALIQHEHSRQLQQKSYDGGLFAIKAGGAAPAIGSSTLKGGVVIDLGLFREITISDDKSRVVIGAGLKWVDVYNSLQPKGLTVAGGRTLPVGVGGLSLQGGISFYSPFHGLVCSTIISYEVVLADGSAVTASETSHSDLWRALKGGSNNFGIVTSFTLPCIPATDIWFGCSFMLGFQAPGLVRAFHKWVEETRSGAYDPHAAGPMTCFGVTSAGVQVTANYLTYTKPTENNKWPTYWAKSPYGKLFHLYSTAKNQSLFQAVTELSEPSEAGKYNKIATVTCKNDLETLEYCRTVYLEISREVRNVKGLIFSLVFQPLLPQWMNKGYPNVLGLEDVTEPLVIVELSLTWKNVKQSDLVRGAVRRGIEKIEDFAKTHKTYHRYKFANYCAEWQRPMMSYGEKNLDFMRGVSRKYDPKGLFQKGCLGSFKLDMEEDTS